MKRLCRLFQIARGRRLNYIWYLLHGHLLPRIGYRLFYEWPRSRLRRVAAFLVVFCLALGTLGIYFIAGLAMSIWVPLLVALFFFLSRWVWAYWSLDRLRKEARHTQRLAEATFSDRTFTSWESLRVSLDTRVAVNRALRQSDDQELVIGHIDSDGRVLGLFGRLEGPANIDSFEEFVPRHRFLLDIVLVGDKVLLRKDFRGARRRFYQEWLNLGLLSGHANVPAVHHVNEPKTHLYKNFVAGRTIRDVLVDAGAHILGIQTDEDPELVKLGGSERLHAILARGTDVLASCFSETFFKKLEAQLEKIHCGGVARLSLTFGNVMLDEEENVWFIDFEGAERFRDVDSFFFHLRRDEDRRKYNQIYCRQLITEESARAELAELASQSPGWYAPVDFGNGLTIGGFWSIQSGTGRWEYINKEVVAPLVCGKRVLDLGTNNAVMPLMMLRAGAKEVVGVEMSDDFIAAARVIHRLFEWRDMREYDLRLIQANMMEIERGCWGEFDVVTAFCTLYYLSEEEMFRVIRHAAQIAPIIVVQANDGTRSSASDGKAKKSSHAFLAAALQRNGFDVERVVAAGKYERPILVGARNNSTSRQACMIN